MKLRILLMCTLTVGIAATARAIDRTGEANIELPYDVVEPSVQLAKRYQKQGDYPTAMLLYDAILKRDPSNNQALKRLVQCHKELAKKELHQKPQETQPVTPAADDGLSELPNLIPTDNVNAQQPAAAPHRPLL